MANNTQIVNFRTFTKTDIEDVHIVKEYHILQDALRHGNVNATIPVYIGKAFGFESYSAFIKRITKEMASTYGLKLFTRVSLRTLREMFADDRLLLNYFDKAGKPIVKNNRQRNEVTSDSWKSKLFLSVMMGVLMDTPVLYVTKNGVTTADGNQRLTALVKILNNEVRITGTKTNLDGHYFKDLDDDLRDVILDLEIDISVIHPNMTIDAFLNDVFTNMNGKQTKVNKAEEAVATHNTVFRHNVQSLVAGNFAGSQKAQNVVTVLGASKNQTSRMRDIEHLLFAYSLVQKLPVKSHGHAVEVMLEEYPDVYGKQEKGIAAIEEMIEIATFMQDVLGIDFLNKLDRDEKGKPMYISSPNKNDPTEYCKATKKARLVRTKDTSSKYFITMFYTMGSLLRESGVTTKSLGTELDADFTDAIRGMSEKIFCSDKFDKLMTGGPTDIKRSKCMLVTLLDAIERKNLTVHENPVINEKIRTNWKNLREDLSRVESLCTL